MLGLGPTSSIWTTLFDVLDSIFEWISEFILSIFTIGEDPGALSSLLPFISISIAVSVIFFAIKLIKKISWGY